MKRLPTDASRSQRNQRRSEPRFGLALAGVPYRLPVGAAFIAALVAVMLSARSERGTRS